VINGGLFPDTVYIRIGRKAGEYEVVVDDTTRMNVRWKTGSQVKRARAKTSMCETY